jgi:hypothetical protein
MKNLPGNKWYNTTSSPFNAGEIKLLLEQNRPVDCADGMEKMGSTSSN